MTRPRTDTPQSAIVKALRMAGYFVAITTAVKKGFPDLLVIGPGEYGRVMLMEVKSQGGRLSPMEEVFMTKYPGPYAIVRTIEEAISAMQIMEVTK
jgi:hypothetical protein